MALAGSAPRGNSEEEDEQLDLELLQSAKNQGEHAIVVTMIREALAHYCSQVWVSDKPQLLRLKNIQHLQTPIIGKLLPGKSILDAIGELHPTPAVGGFPRETALAELREFEQLDRGWYAGPIGWINANGNGEFAVALRSALVDEAQATLFAGGGIVADSQPESEYAETCWKFAVMLRGLGSGD
jgi:isochorismate synthase